MNQQNEEVVQKPVARVEAGRHGDNTGVVWLSSHNDMPKPGDFLYKDPFKSAASVKLPNSTAFGTLGKPVELTQQALQHVINRCMVICQNLNRETHGHERGPDCARRIEKETKDIIGEAVSIARMNKLEETIEYVDNPIDLIVNREYWLFDKATGEAHISVLKAEGPRYYFDDRMWAHPGNNQAMDRWHIFGPLPIRPRPDFQALFGNDPIAAAKTAKEVTEATPVSSDTNMLHATIMNLPTAVPANYIFSNALSDAYKVGHRDARHAAAEVVLAHQPVKKD